MEAGGVNRELTDSARMDTPQFREMATDALRYWEPRRLLYNVLLAAIVIAYFVSGLPESARTLTFNGILGLFVLAVLANVAYCAAYVVDIFGQLSQFRDRRDSWRFVILLVGFAFAATLTRFFALGFFVLIT